MLGPGGPHPPHTVLFPGPPAPRAGSDLRPAGCFPDEAPRAGGGALPDLAGQRPGGHPGPDPERPGPRPWGEAGQSGTGERPPSPARASYRDFASLSHPGGRSRQARPSLPPLRPLPRARSRGPPTAYRCRSRVPGKPGSSPVRAGGCSEPRPRRGPRGPHGPRSGATRKPMAPSATRRWAAWPCSQDPTREPRSLPATPPRRVPAPAAQPRIYPQVPLQLCLAALGPWKLGPF